MNNGDGYSMTQNEYASRRGISQPMVAKMIRQGKLNGAFHKVGRRYLIDPEKADAILRNNRADTKSLPNESITFAEAAKMEKLTRVAILELDLRKKRGELIEKIQVEAMAAKIATLLRVNIEAIPAKLAPTMVGMRNPAEIAQHLQRELKSILTDLSKNIEKIK